jgi:hypothetical protein
MPQEGQKLKTVLIIGTLALGLGGVVSYTDIVQEPAQDTSEVINTGTLTEKQSLDAIEVWQAEQLSNTGKYAQVIEGKRIVTDKISPIVDSVQSKMDDNMEIVEYNGPKGKGYQVIWFSTTTVTNALGVQEVRRIDTKSVGYGPEAASRTWVQ